MWWINMKKYTVTVFILIAITAYIGIGTKLYLEQREHIYFPTEKVTIERGATFMTNGPVLLTGWTLNPGQDDAVIYFGGNSEPVNENIPSFNGIKSHSIYLMNYRGYGDSEGVPTEENLYSDALKIYDTIEPNHKTVSVFGRSLGTGVATYLATKRKIDKLILTTPFDSLTNMAKSMYPIFPIDWMLKEKFDSLSRADKINVPTLVFISEVDEVVPHKHTENLLTKLPKNLTTVHHIKNTNHGTIVDDPHYNKILQDWLAN
jgi:pimeloyl-ACP methyl ester carboxylesterase